MQIFTFKKMLLKCFSQVCMRIYVFLFLQLFRDFFSYNLFFNTHLNSIGYFGHMSTYEHI
jgi:hypothetical protein